MPRRFFTTRDIGSYGLSAADVRGGPRRPFDKWRLPPMTGTVLKGLLDRTGFNADEQIFVHESADPPGFTFTQ